MKARLIDAGINSNTGIKTKKVEQQYLDTPFHFHDNCELVLIEKSYGKRVVGDHVANFNDGDLVLLGPNLPHIWQNDPLFSVRRDYRVVSTVVYFSPALLLQLAEDSGVKKNIASLLSRALRGMQINGKAQEIISDALPEIHEMQGLKKIASFLEVVDLLSRTKEYEFLASSSYVNSYTAKDTSRFNEVYQFIMNNFQRDLSLEEIAQVANMSYSAFCRYFKSKTQKPLTRFINELRIGHACKLLQDENNTIADACFKSGYNNPTNFNNFFKEITGLTPSAYRTKMKDEVRL